MIPVVARKHNRFLPMPRIAVYTFDDGGKQISFVPVDEYLAAELGFQPAISTRDGLMELLKQLIGEEVTVQTTVSIAPLKHTAHTATLESLLDNEQPTSGVVVTLPASNAITSNAQLGVFVERTEVPKLNVRDGRPSYEPIRKVMVSITRDSTYHLRDPTALEIGSLKGIDYTSAKSGIVNAILDNKALAAGLNGVQALVHDLRGTLRYNGFYLAEADLEGIRRLTLEAYIRGIPFIGTVTSGTVSEGTNFMRWVQRVGYSTYHPYKVFAICDSLTTAKVLTLNYDQLLVSGETVGKINQSLDELLQSEEGKTFANFLHAWKNWTNKDTQNSIIIDIPPEQPQEYVDSLIWEANQFRDYFRSKFGEDISVISKSAVTRGVNTIRLYVRPGVRGDGKELTKGSSLDYYLNQNGVAAIDRAVIYFTDKYATPEEISLGRHALIGVEIDTKQKTPIIEFGKYGVTALITVPTYLMGADIVTNLLSRALPKSNLLFL